MEYLSTHTHTFGDILGADRADHEFLESDGGVGVRATVDDIHHGNGQHVAVRSADVTIERQAQIVGGSVGDREGNTQNRIRAQLALGCRSVQFDHGLVDETLLEAGHPDDFRSDLLIDVLHSLEDTFAAVALRIPVTQFERLVLAGRSPGRNRCHSDHTGFEFNLAFNRRVSSGIKDFPTCNSYNSHNKYSLTLIKFAGTKIRNHRHIHNK